MQKQMFPVHEERNISGRRRMWKNRSEILFSREERKIYDIDEKKLKLIRIMATPNIEKLVIYFGASCLRRAREEFLSGPIMCSARIETCTMTTFGCLAEKESRGDFRQMPYLSTHPRYLVTEAVQLKENIRPSEERFAGKQFYMITEKLLNWLVGPSTKETHLDLNEDRFKKCVRDALEILCDCHSAQIVESVEVELLEKPSTVISNEEGQRRAM